MVKGMVMMTLEVANVNQDLIEVKDLQRAQVGAVGEAEPTKESLETITTVADIVITYTSIGNQCKQRLIY